jgi:hypothetical protein
MNMLSTEFSPDPIAVWEADQRAQRAAASRGERPITLALTVNEVVMLAASLSAARPKYHNGMVLRGLVDDLNVGSTQQGHSPVDHDALLVMLHRAISGTIEGGDEDRIYAPERL